jgi:hypothetical protein
MGDAHNLEVLSSFLEDGYRIVCSCGWRTVLAAPSQEVALEQGEQHRSEADSLIVLGSCPHGVDLDREFCPHGCRV